MKHFLNKIFLFYFRRSSSGRQQHQLSSSTFSTSSSSYTPAPPPPPPPGFTYNPSNPAPSPHVNPSTTQNPSNNPNNPNNDVISGVNPTSGTHSAPGSPKLEHQSSFGSKKTVSQYPDGSENKTNYHEQVTGHSGHSAGQKQLHHQLSGGLHVQYSSEDTIEHERYVIFLNIWIAGSYDKTILMSKRYTKGSPKKFWRKNHHKIVLSYLKVNQSFCEEIWLKSMKSEDLRRILVKVKKSKFITSELSLTM